MTGNLFIDNVYNLKRRKFGFIQKLKILYFIYKLKKVVPDFNILWDIADFLKAL